MTLVAQDRASVRVDNVFSDLIDLRTSLLANDSSGITVAGERMAASADRLTLAQALVGGYGRQVIDGTSRVQDVMILDETTRAGLQDLDVTEAASRFSLLQTQLQASLQTTSSLQSLSLIDFLR
jgi:flagellin-like hook-associated protein FlgL